MARQRKMRASLVGRAPGLTFERQLWNLGKQVVVGLDEVGRGSWAGPLTVGAVVVNRERRIIGVRDSKMLNEAERETIIDRIIDWALFWSVGHASNLECDELGMSEAQRLAASRALGELGVVPDHVLIDGTWDFLGAENTTTVVHGDQRSLSIAAASVIAKVTRDRILRSVSAMYPPYGFAENKGYPSPKHRAALESYGASEYHRRSWSFMRGYRNFGDTSGPDSA